MDLCELTHITTILALKNEICHTLQACLLLDNQPAIVVIISEQNRMPYLPELKLRDNKN